MKTICAALIGSILLPLSAATFGPGVRLIPADVGATNLYGISVAASGNILAVGAPLNGPGAVYIYQRSGDGWIQQSKLVRTDGTGAFGVTVALDGNTLIVDGEVFVNSNGTWTEQALLPAGFASVSRDTIAVGTSSAVFVYVRANGVWTQQASIPMSNSFIVTVALENDTLVVGSPNMVTPAGASAGRAYIFGRQNGVWTQQAALEASDAQAASLFGFGLTVSGTTVVVGAPGRGVFQDLPGAAYVYVGSNGVWTQQAELFGVNVDAGSDFGTSIALIGNTLLVGAYEDDSTGGTGTAHIFLRNGSTWTDTFILAPGQNGIPAPGSPEQRFANAVAMDGGNTFIMGSPTFTDPSNFSATIHEGAVYSVTLH